MKTITSQVEPDLRQYDLVLPALGAHTIVHNFQARAADVQIAENTDDTPTLGREVIAVDQPDFNRIVLTNLTAKSYRLIVDVFWQVLVAGSGYQFRVDSYGDLVRINGVAYQWPSLPPTAGQALTYDGVTGKLKWQSGGGGGGMAIGGAVAGGTPGNVLYVGPGSVLAQVPNGAGALTNDGAGNLSWSTPATSAVTGLYTCPGTVAVGDAVYSSGSGSCDKADADVPAQLPVIGFVISKPTATSAVVQYYGEASVFGGLVPDATYFLSTTPGQITTTAPSAPGSAVQRLGFAKTATTLVLMVDRDFVVLS